MSTHPGEVAFYKAAFQAGLRLPIHSTIRRILYYYNIYLAQLVPNAWRSVVCTVVLWQFHKFALSLIELRNLFGLFNNLKPDPGWVYYKARPKEDLARGVPQQCQRVEEQILLHLRGQLGVSPRVISG
ncbi:hypothetical protein Acr_09g0005630 [Actinidia rufa]|uniref:Transposase (putative) gypsy type domain-containing protein n=1 Tax=Actinidia rufa TaxID=165716 RepID=A0A7J0F861_9ERIC|nr:hypothetical protein Acr_09g0005630 [Actinidia rufa]